MCNETYWEMCRNIPIYKYTVWLCKTLPSNLPLADGASPIHNVSEERAISWLTLDDKWTVGVMTMQDDHRTATAT